MRRLGAWLGMLLGLVPVPRARAETASVQRFAIVIGNNQAEASSSATLRYADDDALATEQLLREAGVESRVLTRLDETTRGLHPDAHVDGVPSYDELIHQFALLAEKMRDLKQRGIDSELLIFFGGHGDVEHGEGYVVLEGRRLTRSMFYSLLQSSPARQNHVFIDACKSYYLVFDRGPGGRRVPYAAFGYASVPAALANTGFVLSTSSDRDSHEWERYQGGVLSHELRSGLRGAADADLDGKISYAELGAFLTVANQSIKNPRFRPDFMVRAPGQDFQHPLLSWRLDQARLELAPGRWGHVYVETARGERVIDAHPVAGAGLRLWVPADRPLFVRRQDETAEAVVSERDPVRISQLSATPQIASRGALSLAFEWLFEAPFGETNVRDFQRLANSSPAREDPEPPASTPRRNLLRPISAGVAIGAATLGLALNGIALGRSRTHSASQRAAYETNEAVSRLIGASIVAYGAAAVAGATWAWATFGRKPATVMVSPTPVGVAGRTGWGLSIGGRF